MCSYVLSALEAIAGPKGSDVIDLASTPSGDLPHGTPPMLMIGDAETGKGLPFVIAEVVGAIGALHVVSLHLRSR
jgi:hypothetical protein